MRIQKKNNDLYQSKIALANSLTNASNILSLNSDITTIENTIFPITGNINALSGNISAVSGTLNTVSGNLVTLQSKLNFITKYYYNNDQGYFTTSTTPFAANIGTSATYTKKAGTQVLITVTFGIRTGNFTGNGAQFYYRNNTPDAWSNIGSVNYRVLNSLQTSQFSVLNSNSSAGTYTFGFAASVNTSGHTVYIDTISYLVQELTYV